MTITDTTTDAAQFTVASSKPNRGIVAEIIASLPVSYAWADDALIADVVEIDGSDGWVGRARDAAQRGTRAVIVTRPTAAAAEDVSDLADTADEAGTTVVLAEPFAGNAAIATLLHDNPGAFDDITAITVLADSIDGADADLVLSQIRVLRALGLARPTVTSRVAGIGGVGIAGTVHGAVLACVGTRTHATNPRVVVRAYGRAHAVELELPSTDTARPAVAVITGTTGALQQPTVYETAYRTAWRATHAALIGPITTNDALRLFAEDLRTVHN